MMFNAARPGAVGGYRGGRASLESGGDRDPAPRQEALYQCPRGQHLFVLVLAANADAPTTWACRRHGVDGTLLDAAAPVAPPAVEDPLSAYSMRIHKSAWDMLRERRTIPELDALLNERLAELAAARQGVTA